MMTEQFFSGVMISAACMFDPCGLHGWIGGDKHRGKQVCEPVKQYPARMNLFPEK